MTNFNYREYHELGNKLYMIVTKDMKVLNEKLTVLEMQ